MSNRVYLYSTNFVPGMETDVRRIVGISEWGNDIPITFKLLLSGQPQKCQSLIFENAHAVIGDYKDGVSHLMQFLDRVPHPSVAFLKEEAEGFLSAEDNRNRFLVLEPEEYFWLGGKGPTDVDQLLTDMADLRPQMEKAIADLNARTYEEDHPPGFFARLFGAKTPVRRDDSNDMVFALGLGCWNNLLFCKPQ